MKVLVAIAAFALTVYGVKTRSVSPKCGESGLHLTMLDSSGAAIQQGKTLEVKANTKVTVKVTGSILDILGLNAYATSCHTTPSKDPMDVVSYSLLKNGCPQDSTLKIFPDGRGQKMTFTSFAFTKDVSAKVYVHCELIACKASDGCGKCMASENPSENPSGNPNCDLGPEEGIHIGVRKGSIAQKGGPTELQLNLLDSSGAVIQANGTSHGKLNRKITAIVTGANLEDLDINAYAKTCHATPSADPKDPLSYTLLKNGCPQDSTFKIVADGRGQKMTFNSFAFTKDLSAAIYLHCELVSCKASAGCGLCRSALRRR